MNAVATIHFLDFIRWMEIEYWSIYKEWLNSSINNEIGLDEYVKDVHPNVFEEWKVFDAQG